MGFLSLYEGTERIPLHGDYFVTVKKFLSSEDYDEAKKALTHFNVDDPTTDKTDEKAAIRPDPNVPEYQRELVVAAIVDWNLTDQNDQLLPLEPVAARRAAVKRLPEVVVTKLYKAVQKNDADPEPQAAATFPAGSDGGGEGGDGWTAGAEAVQPGAGVLDALRSEAGGSPEAAAP